MPAVPNILVVDDDSVQLLVVDATLTRSGYSVFTAGNGQDAMAILRSGRRIDLVVTDLHMPDGGGADLVSFVRSTPALRDVPVIVLTGSQGEANDEVAVMNAGADDYLRKPVDPLRLIARVRAALRRTGAPEAQPASQLDASELSAVKRVSRQIIIPPDPPDE
jgi:DNA-binding response OmpR family regulator